MLVASRAAQLMIPPASPNDKCFLKVGVLVFFKVWREARLDGLFLISWRDIAGNLFTSFDVFCTTVTDLLFLFDGLVV